MTNGEFVSNIIGGVNALNKDDYISRRLVLSIGRSLVSTFVSQRLDQKKLWKDYGLINTLRCFELKKDDIVSCDIVEFRRCNSLMKSKKQLPELMSSNSKVSVVSVYSLDGSVFYTYKTPKQYSLDKNRKYSDIIDGDYYYIHNRHLYLPDSNVEAVNVDVITLDLYDLDKLSGCGSGKCKSVWDYEFVCPDKLLGNVIDLTYQKVFNKKRIPEDENPNLDSNLKSKTVN